MKKARRNETKSNANIKRNEEKSLLTYEIH